MATRRIHVRFDATVATAASGRGDGHQPRPPHRRRGSHGPFSSERAGAYTQYFRSDDLDASALLKAIVGFLPRDDPRLLPKIDAIEQGLLSAKLWSVYPKLFTWPPVRDLVHALERLSVLAGPTSGRRACRSTTPPSSPACTWWRPTPATGSRVRGPTGTLSLSLADLAALPQTTVELPIACVEGWSATAHWTGVRVRDLIARVGGRPGRDHVVVQSMQRGSAYAVSTVDASHTADPLSLIALRVNGETLHIDHGYPCRLIAPNRPGAMQTKWLLSVTVVPG